MTGTEWIITLKAAPVLRVQADTWKLSADGQFISFMTANNTTTALVAVSEIVSVVDREANRSA